MNDLAPRFQAPRSKKGGRNMEEGTRNEEDGTMRMENG